MHAPVLVAVRDVRPQVNLVVEGNQLLQALGVAAHEVVRREVRSELGIVLAEHVGVAAEEAQLQSAE